MHVNAAHIARLALLEAALSAVLREAQGAEPFDEPDAVQVTLSASAGSVGEVTYMRDGHAVGGESL
jgi:hypothetical protein